MADRDVLVNGLPQGDNEEGEGFGQARRSQMDWQDRIIVDPKVLVGKPVVKGTRISVELVIELLARGWSVEQILQEYSHLTAEDIRACLAYASDMLKDEKVYLTPT
jgi:uncharacterized protein (DUF433 family)